MRYTGHHQLGLAILSIGVFLLSTAPLELQRRIVNAIVDRGALRTVLWLAAAYAGVAVAQQSLKLALNLYRGWVAESTVRTLRASAGSTAAALLAEHGHRVVVLEREKFPRYHIGESLIPHTYGILGRLGLLPKLRASAFP